MLDTIVYVALISRSSGDEPGLYVAGTSADLHTQLLEDWCEASDIDNLKLRASFEYAISEGRVSDAVAIYFDYMRDAEVEFLEETTHKIQVPA